MATNCSNPSSARDGAIGIIIVDHGSRRRDSNRRFEQLVHEYENHGSHAMVEPAHMDLAMPDLAAAFDNCVTRGATFIVVQPFFLLPGRHLEEDIPQLVSAAATRHPGIGFTIAAPVGLHPLMSDIMEACIARAIEVNEPVDP
ncbi:MAG: hypothetical protein GY906_04580 [bacterium]|nr:hypothetical protein [bacterium]